MGITVRPSWYGVQVEEDAYSCGEEPGTEPCHSLPGLRVEDAVCVGAERCTDGGLTVEREIADGEPDGGDKQVVG